MTILLRIYCNYYILYICDLGHNLGSAGPSPEDTSMEADRWRTA